MAALSVWAAETREHQTASVVASPCSILPVCRFALTGQLPEEARGQMGNPCFNELKWASHLKYLPVPKTWINEMVTCLKSGRFGSLLCVVSKYFMSSFSGSIPVPTTGSAACVCLQRLIPEASGCVKHQGGHHFTMN